MVDKLKKRVMESAKLVMRYKELIKQMPVEGTLQAQVHSVFKADGEPVNGEGEMDQRVVMVQAIATAFGRLAYDLSYSLEKEGLEITKSALEMLMELIAKNFDKNFALEESTFMDLAHWNFTVDATLLEIKHLKGEEGKVGIDYMDAISMKVAMGQIEQTDAEQTVIKYVSETVKKIGAALNDNEKQLLFGEVKYLSERYEERTEILMNEESFLAFIIKQIQIICDELFIDGDIILENEKELRDIVPKRLAEFEPILEKHLIYVWTQLRGISKLNNILPEIKAVWNGLITSYMRVVKSELEAMESEEEEEIDEDADFGKVKKSPKDFGAN